MTYRVVIFRLHTQFILENLDMACAIKAEVDIISQRLNLELRAIEFIATSDQFDDVEHGVPIPVYNIMVLETETMRTIRFLRA